MNQVLRFFFAVDEWLHVWYARTMHSLAGAEQPRHPPTRPLRIRPRGTSARPSA